MNSTFQGSISENRVAKQQLTWLQAMVSSLALDRRSEQELEG